MKQLLAVVVCAITGFTTTTEALAQGEGQNGHRRVCEGLPSADQLRLGLATAPTTGGDAGGLFHGFRMWGAIVNRAGEICVFVASTENPSQVWPGSQAIAKAKAYTANAFSLDAAAAQPPIFVFALSTARLYTLVQPDHSLFGLNNSNPFDPGFLAAPNGEGGGRYEIAGGIITFGGGVPLYRDGKIIGGLGISGDTACTDHEIAKRVRSWLGLDPPGGSSVDDILYTSLNGPGPLNHPLCVNTWKNGVFVGNEEPNEGPEDVHVGY